MLSKVVRHDSQVLDRRPVLGGRQRGLMGIRESQEGDSAGVIGL